MLGDAHLKNNARRFFGGLYLVLGVILLIVLVFSITGKIKDPEKENPPAGGIKHQLEISTKGSVVLWENGEYYPIINVDGMPDKKNTAVLIQRTPCRSAAEWVELRSLNTRDIIDVFHYSEKMTSGSQAIYAKAALKAILGEKDEPAKPSSN